MAFNTVGSRRQVDLLLGHFRVKKNISNLEAQSLFKIRALPRRISDLEEMGYFFRRERKKDTTGQAYVRYHFLGKADVNRGE